MIMEQKKISLETERSIQVQCVNWFRENHPDYIIFGTFNELASKRWGRFEPMGAMAGAPDITVVLPNKVVFIEMKNKKGTQSEQQVNFQKRCEMLGIQYFVCNSVEKFKKIFETL